MRIPGQRGKFNVRLRLPTVASGGILKGGIGMIRYLIVGTALLAAAGCATQRTKDPAPRADQMFKQMPVSDSGTGDSVSRK